MYKIEKLKPKTVQHIVCQPTDRFEGRADQLVDVTIELTDDEEKINEIIDAVNDIMAGRFNR
jgi:hypothetical protein